METYSGYRADERPVSFRIQQRTFHVEEVLDRWYGVDEDYFKVRAEDGNHYVLKHYRLSGEWTLESFRHVKEEP